MDLPSLTREEVREVDRLAIEELGIPGCVLMENAARGAAEVIRDLVEGDLDRPAGRAPVAVVLCGAGNNGGDGYAVARHLANAGWDVAVHALIAGERLSGDAALNREIVEAMGLPVDDLVGEPGLRDAAAAWSRADVVVDALLGTGFRGDVREPLASAIAVLNEAGARRVVALDVPSGLDADSGQPSNATVRATHTVTFVARKRGFDDPASDAWTGPVTVRDIGAPPALAARVLAERHAGAKRADRGPEPGPAHGKGASS